MLEELSRATQAYMQKWRKLVDARTDQEFFTSLKPTAVAWKTTDLNDFNRRFIVLRDLSDQIHLGWINERWLATFHLKDTVFEDGITVVKLMQRRPGSADTVGLDHLDFYYAPGTSDAKQIVAAEAGITWTEEHNGKSKWLSIWFDNTEAKLRTDTVLAVCIREMNDCEQGIVS